jgi:hypothetical protein
MLIRNKPILSSERILHKDFDHEDSVGEKKKVSNHELQGARHQDELVGCQNR